MPIRRWTYLVFAVLALVVLTGAFTLPVFRIYGDAMFPALQKGDVVAAVKGEEWGQGDIIALQYHNKILIKRLIALPGSRVEIGSDGTVYVDGNPLVESYLNEKNAGISSTEFPCTVPEGTYFVLGDKRSVSADSRNAQIGCVTKEQVIGRVVFRLWPIGRMGGVE